ncbi:MAG: ribbon-helix-helix protein, CopG family [Acidimicrobiales bacterium]
MAKPKAIQWLEEQTGQSIDFVPETATSGERHLSVRLSDDLATGLGALAAERKVTVSQLVRELLSEAVTQRQAVASLDARALAERLAVDVAEVRRRLAG